MSNEMVSIIVPIYNSEQYLETCLDSILAQTYTNLDIILIDDGSTDASGDICDAYAEKDHRIRVFHNTNQGVSYSRNYGIKAAKGRYLLFIDSDDTIAKNYVIGFVPFIGTYDLIISNLTDVWEDKCITRKINGMLSGNFTMDIYAVGSFLRLLFSKIYIKEIIEKNDILFPEDVAYKEDQLFNYEYYKHIKTCAFVSGAPYYYYHRENNSLSIQGATSESLKLIQNVLQSSLCFLSAIKSPVKDLFFSDSLFLYFINVHGGYANYKAKCGLLRKIAEGHYEASSWKRWLVLKCLQYRIYPLIYLYYRMKYLLHK